MRVPSVGESKNKIFQVAVIWGADDQMASGAKQLLRETRQVARSNDVLDYLGCNRRVKVPSVGRRFGQSSKRRGYAQPRKLERMDYPPLTTGSRTLTSDSRSPVSRLLRDISCSLKMIILSYQANSRQSTQPR